MSAYLRGAGARRIAKAALALVLSTAVAPAAALAQGAGEPASMDESATASALAQSRAAPASAFGKITRETEPVPGARVLAYASFADLLAFRAAAASEPADAGGGYRLSLPPGTYYLTARGEGTPSDGPVPVGGLFSFHGSNPFTLVPGSAIEANFSLAKKLADPVVEPGADQTSGTLAGTVTWEGRGVEGVQVKLYLDAESAFRGMGYAAAPPTDGSGAFTLDLLPESDYYVVARRRAAGAGPGPLAEGDLYGYFVDNPVRVRNGGVVRIAFELVSKGRDTGNADGRPRPSGTRISGRITDGDGAVVPGVYAFAYEEKVMAHKKPAFISQPVDAEGRYVIHLGRGGTFYVGARSAYGDSPGRGEWYGRYDGAPDHAVAVADGAAVDGVDIRVERILE